MNHASARCRLWAGVVIALLTASMALAGCERRTPPEVPVPVPDGDPKTPRTSTLSTAPPPASMASQ